MDEEKPVVAAAEIGLGSLRAARPLAQAMRTSVLRVDAPPMSSRTERALWETLRKARGWTVQAATLPRVGKPIRRLVDRMTTIPPLHPHRDSPDPSFTARALELAASRGLGQGWLQDLVRGAGPLVATHPVAALVACYGGVESIHCVLTHADAARLWVPCDPRQSRMRYYTATRRAVRRLEAFGVPREDIVCTGFPLPEPLVGGAEMEVLERSLAARLVRLDPNRRFRETMHDDRAHHFAAEGRDHEGEPPRLTFVARGAGDEVGRWLPRLAPRIASDRIRLTLVAGTRADLAETFRLGVERAGLGAALGGSVEVAWAPDLEGSLEQLELLLGRTDVLWSAPTELIFYGALGLPLVLTRPVGVHERFNRRYAREQGVGLKQGNAEHLPERLGEWLADGTLAAAAWAGYLRLPKFGTPAIADAVTKM